MKVVKKLGLFIVFALVCLVKINGVKAEFNGNYYTVEDKYSFSCYVGIGGSEERTFSISGIKVNNQDVYKLSINGQTALCLNYNLQLGAGRYKIVEVLGGRDSNGQIMTHSTQLYRLWNYANESPDHYYDAQIALWVMLSTNLNNWNSAYYTSPFSNFDSLKAAYPDFVSSFQAKSNNCSNKYGALSVRNGEVYGLYQRKKLIKKGGQVVESNSYIDTTNMYSCDIFETDKDSYIDYCQKQNDSYSKEQCEEYYSYVNTLYGFNQKGYLKYGNVITSNYEEMGGFEILGLYNDISDSKYYNANTTLAIWCPVEDNEKSGLYRPLGQDYGQCVIAPYRISCATCTAEVLRLQEKYSPGTKAYDDELARLKGLYKQLVVDENGKISCGKEECVEINRTIKKYPGAFRSNALKKYSNYMRSRNIKVVTTKKELYCGNGKVCITEKDKFKSTYSCNCDKFKDALDTKGSDVKSCDPKSCVVECDEGEDNTCSSLLPSYYGPQSADTFEDFKSKITDPEKAYHNADGTISCNQCEPDVDTSKALCDVEGKKPSFFTLRDAANTDGTPKDVCYKNGIAYQIGDDGKQGSKDENLSKSEYCDVYCWESVDVNLPTSPSAWGAVTAGEVFYWGLEPLNNIFARLETKRICWTKPDYNKFANDWAANEADISQKYADYMAQAQFNAKTDNDVTEVPNSKCCLDNKTKCPGSEGRIYKLDAVTYTIPGTNVTGTSISGTSNCTTTKPKASDFQDANEEKRRYDAVADAVANRYTLKKKLMACQSNSVIKEDTIYDYSKAKMSFSSDTQTNLNLTGYGVGSADLVGSVESSSLVNNSQANAIPKYFACSGYNGGIKKSNINEADICEGLNNITVDNYETNGFVWDYTGSYVFKYSKEFFFVAKKVNSIITNQVDSNPEKPSQYELDNNLYYILGYGLPSAFTKQTGYFNVKINMSGFGNNGHFDKITLADDAKEKYGYDFKDGYSCPYFVHNPLYQSPCEFDCNPATLTCKLRDNAPAYCCDPSVENCGKGSLSIIYRLIDMAAGDTVRIFPSVDGDGRNPGSNWMEFIGDRNTTYKNITTYSKIYDASPMYSIELTPTNIGKIRKSNTSYREDGKDPYTSYKDTSDKLKIICDDHDDKTKSCISTYVTELIRMNVIKGGTFRIESEGHRLTKLHNYKTCYDVNSGEC